MMQSPGKSSKAVRVPAPRPGVVEQEGRADEPEPPRVVRRWDYPTHTIRPAERHE
ncbi:hypothetical protein EV279_3183 [Microbacterium sp. BK668]|nr:hypothetical protein EV279_3183 [Microbacterium sp. BK668]